MTDATTPEQPQTAERCPYRAGWCEREAGHGEDHYTTYRSHEMWTLLEAQARPAASEGLRAALEAALLAECQSPTSGVACIGADWHEQARAALAAAYDAEGQGESE